MANEPNESNWAKRAAVVGLIAATVLLSAFSFSTLSKGLEDGKPEPRVTPLSEFDPAKVYRSRTVKIPHRSPSAPCRPLHFSFAGGAKRYGQESIAHYTVPKGRTWRITNVSLLAERHTGGRFAEAGEWTAQLAGGDGRTGFTIAQSSLDTGSGIALQGQGRTNVTLEEGNHLRFSVWLRDGLDRNDYYFTLSASGTDC